MTPARGAPPAGPPPAGEGQRLAKVVAALVPCSRREAEQYIAEGWVRVDGQRVDAPQVRVTADQRVELDPQARLQPAVPATFLLHKPVGVTTEAARDLLAESGRWSGDASGIRPSKAHQHGLEVLLPLPPQASGLCVFSQDFRIVRKLTEDAAFVEQELVAEVKGAIAPDGLARLGQGLVRNGRLLPPARVSWQSETRLRFAVKGIAPADIGWMCAQVGLELTALRRIRIGRIPMAGLPPGQWRYLPAGERF
ncbi:MAG TPA: RNA pseudouridine synthase [Ramlibacter sp.]|uniref:RNA pseudouridine synthase n=1 Tax=Ramlibacter sp. TaxID=1917967 RepID=UPI002D810992|nr:RNA pseudouridine synthase [Ramlibacter sp.]HET8745906.1 RNA pseudouridine synthase [Ramlibacter sp.]